MNERFDSIDKRLDKIEAKLDKYLESYVEIQIKAATHEERLDNVGKKVWFLFAAVISMAAKIIHSVVSGGI